MINVVFFPLVCVIALCLVLFVYLRIGCRPGQRRIGLAGLGAIVCCIALLIGSIMTLSPHLSKSMIAPNAPLALMDNRELVQCWRDFSSKGPYSHADISSEIQRRLEKGNYTRNSQAEILQRATRLVVEDSDGLGRDWIATVRRWALEGNLTPSETEAVVNAAIEENTGVETDQYSSGSVSVRVLGGSLLQNFSSLLFENEQIQLGIRVTGIEIDGVIYDNIDDSWNHEPGHYTGGSGGMNFFLKTRDEDIKMPAGMLLEDKLAQGALINVLCTTEIKLVKSTSSEAVDSDQWFKLDGKWFVDPDLRISSSLNVSDNKRLLTTSKFIDSVGMYSRPAPQKPLQLTTDPLAASLVRSVLESKIQVTASPRDESYTLSINSRLNWAPGKQSLPFSCALLVEPLGVSVTEKIFDASPYIESQQTSIQPRETPLDSTTFGSSQVRCMFSCIGEIPDVIDLRCYFSEEEVLSNKLSFDAPSPVFFGGEVILKDVPVVIAKVPGSQN